MSDLIRFPEGIEKYVRNLLARIAELEQHVKKLEEQLEGKDMPAQRLGIWDGTVSLYGERDAYEHFLNDL